MVTLNCEDLHLGSQSNKKYKDVASLQTDKGNDKTLESAVQTSQFGLPVRLDKFWVLLLCHSLVVVQYSECSVNEFHKEGSNVLMTHT